MSIAIQLVNGIALGFIYCLIAIEYSIVFNTSGLMNLGHDKYIMLGAYIFGGTYAIGLALPAIPSVLLTIITMVLVGIFVGSVAFNPLRHLASTYAITGCLSLSLMLVQLVRLVYGSVPFTVPGFLSGIVRIGGVPITKSSIATIIIAIVILIAQWIMMMKTKVGRAMRAVSQDTKASAIMGINVNKLMLFTTGLSIGLCGLIGTLLVPLYGISTNMTLSIANKAFCASVVGGFGNINGAIVGGLFVGIAEAVYSILGGPGIYKDMVSFIMIVAFLLFRPQGILGQSVRRN